MISIQGRSGLKVVEAEEGVRSLSHLVGHCKEFEFPFKCNECMAMVFCFLSQGIFICSRKVSGSGLETV